MQLAFDEIRTDEYSEAVEARNLGELLIRDVAEHEHLQQAAIGYIFRDDEITRHGKVTWAEAIMVERILQSEKRWARLVKWAILRILSQFGETLPDFIVLIDRNVWQGLDADQKLALVDHELSHCWYATEEDGVTQKFHKDGSPWWSVRGHDMEEFEGVVLRNGLWSEDLRGMARAIINRLASERHDEARVA